MHSSCVEVDLVLTSLIPVSMSSLRAVGLGDDAIECSRMGNILPATNSRSFFPDSGRYRSAPTTPLVM
jgi:hypothetical protein